MIDAAAGNGVDVIQADLTLMDDAFHADMQIEIQSDGTIGRIGRLNLPVDRRLKRQAVLPGMINAHSHAFQRGLRGRCESFALRGGNFWTWRDEMYAFVNGLDADATFDWTVKCFGEMLRAGITTVGEFHYLHHSANDDSYQLDDVVLSAAAQVGIRVVLLQTCYLTGDVAMPIEGAQRRFASRDIDDYFRQCDQASRQLRKSTQSIGLAPHSVRAVPIDDIVRIHQRAKSDRVPFHIHVEEQRQEIERCVRHYGARPMELLLDRLDVGPEFTAIHCTHTVADDLARFADSGATVCACPSTEGNLGDGIADIGRYLAGGGHVCLGSDCNVRLDFNEDMRWLEYVQRLRLERRGVCTDARGDAAGALWRVATVNGARSLNVNAGIIQTGRHADLISIDLDSPALDGWSPETLLAAFVFGCDSRVIKGVCVGGNWIV
ncbi:MAG: formimidoylglutamate deiminase [Phycisphaerales bacterium]|nr:formimidoylglutamate deiminase [Phycisphaerales bacterium]